MLGAPQQVTRARRLNHPQGQASDFSQQIFTQLGENYLPQHARTPLTQARTHHAHAGKHQSPHHQGSYLTA